MPDEDAKSIMLLVDEDAARRAAFQSSIGDVYDVSCTDDAGSVLDAAIKADVVILNLLASRVHPFQILRRLRDSKDASQKPVLVLAPADSEESLAKCLEMGASDFWVGSLHAPLLRARIDSLIERRRMEQRLAAGELQDLRVEEALKASEKYERDVLIGRQIQTGFLPKDVPQPEGWEIAGRFQPAREVAGDWWDAFSLDHIRRTGLVIADVADKGVGAALFMALMRSLIRAFAQMPSSLRWLDALDSTGPLASAGSGGAVSTPGRRREAPTAGSTALRNAIEQTNNYIAHNHGDTGMFATLFFGILDPSTGLLQYINGGHEPPILMDSQGNVKARLQPTGMAVGMLEGSAFEAHNVHLEPGDLLLAYTDGVTEARDPDRKFFTEQHLLTICNRPVTTAASLLDRIMDNLRAHIADADQFDDITMIAVRRLPA